MSHSIRPYQPILLRLLHGLSAFLAVLAAISGFWVYNIYDKRWGSLPLVKIPDIQGIHGSIALIFFLLLPVFALYSFHIGYHRLFQKSSWSQLSQLGTPIGWVSLHRLANTVMLLASTFAVITGRMMKEEWLPAGELNHLAYSGHLIAWLGILLSLGLHILLGVKVGGVPLLISMFTWVRRDEDQLRLWRKGLKFPVADWILTLTETVVIGGIFVALIGPLFTF